MVVDIIHCLHLCVRNVDINLLIPINKRECDMFPHLALDNFTAEFFYFYSYSKYLISGSRVPRTHL